MSFYNHKEIEPSGGATGQNIAAFKTGTDASKPKF